jgi:hypothetical protein
VGERSKRVVFVATPSFPPGILPDQDRCDSTRSVPDDPAPDQAPQTRAAAFKRFQPLLDRKQTNEVRKMYLSAFMKPKEIAGVMNKTHGLKLTALQVSEFVRARGWTKKRKSDEERIVVLAENKKEIISRSEQIVAQHKDFIDATSRIASKVVMKSEQFVDTARDAKSLTAAANALRTGAELYRKTVGLDSSEPSSFVNRGVINVNFATSDESPFSKAKQAMAAAQPTIDLDPDQDQDDQGASEENHTGAEEN